MRILAVFMAKEKQELVTFRSEQLAAFSLGLKKFAIW
jgi:hypothetical protein